MRVPTQEIIHLLWCGSLSGEILVEKSRDFLPEHILLLNDTERKIEREREHVAQADLLSPKIFRQKMNIKHNKAEFHPKTFHFLSDFLSRSIVFGHDVSPNYRQLSSPQPIQFHGDNLIW